MWKGACAGIAAIVLLGAGNVKAGDTHEFQKDFQVGPLKISVQGKSGMEIGAPAAPAADYWLGVDVLPGAGTAAVATGIGRTRGRHSDPRRRTESPAAKAGLRHDDVLWKAGGKILASPEDLIQAVNAGKDKKLALELIRGGKKVTVSVQPEQRPAPREGKGGRRLGRRGRFASLARFPRPRDARRRFADADPRLRPGSDLAARTPALCGPARQRDGDHHQARPRAGQDRGPRGGQEMGNHGKGGSISSPRDVRPYVDQMRGPAPWRGMVAGKAGMGFGGPWMGGPMPGPGMMRSSASAKAVGRHEPADRRHAEIARAPTAEGCSARPTAAREIQGSACARSIRPDLRNQSGFQPNPLPPSPPPRRGSGGGFFMTANRHTSRGQVRRLNPGDRFCVLLLTADCRHFPNSTPAALRHMTKRSWTPGPSPAAASRRAASGGLAPTAASAICRPAAGSRLV